MSRTADLARRLRAAIDFARPSQAGTDDYGRGIREGLKRALHILETDAPVAADERVAALEEEVAHWKRVALDPEIVLRATGEGVSVGMRHALVARLVDGFGAMLGDAPNYQAIECHHRVHGRIIVTVQRGSGKSPHELAAEYRARLEALGVADLAPLPPAPTMQQPDPEAAPHLWINAVSRTIECRACGGTAPFETPMLGERFGELTRAFADLHRDCEGRP